MSALRAIAVLACALALGCADYISTTSPARRAYEALRTDEALSLFPKEAEAGDDLLLVLLDKGMVLHAAQRWAESREVLARAEKLSAELDAVSVSEEAKSLLTNDRNRAYPGEDFEKLLVNVLQALNYAMLGDHEGALVEVRRCNERLRKMVQDEKKPYEQLAIARLLGGILFEDDGDLDAAFIDYRAALEAAPSLELLGAPLLRLAKQTGRLDELDQLKARFKDLAPPAPLGPGEGQLWVIVEAGRAPEKQPAGSHDYVYVTPTGRHRGYAHSNSEFPAFRSRGRPAPAQVAVAGTTAAAQRVTSVEEVAKKNLEDRIGKLIARAVARTAVKAGLAVAAGAAARDEGVGWLVFLLLSLSNQADLRSWMSLPNEFQAALFRLPIGTHEVTVGSEGTESKHTVEIRSKHSTLLVLRRY